MRRWWPRVGLGIATLLVVAGLVIAIQSRRAATGSPQPWGAFSMQYRVMAPEQLDPAKDLFQVWTLEYRNKRDWSQTLLSDDAYPARAGSTERFDGDTLAKFNALANTTTKLPSEEGALAVPHRWLVPKRVEDYRARGFESETQDGAGTVRLVKQETLACTPGEPAGDSRCPPAGVIDGMTEIVVNRDGVPQRVIESVASRAYVVFEVEQLLPFP